MELFSISTVLKNQSRIQRSQYNVYTLALKYAFRSCTKHVSKI